MGENNENEYSVEIRCGHEYQEEPMNVFGPTAAKFKISGDVSLEEVAAFSEIKAISTYKATRAHAEQENLTLKGNNSTVTIKDPYGCCYGICLEDERVIDRYDTERIAKMAEEQVSQHRF